MPIWTPHHPSNTGEEKELPALSDYVNIAAEVVDILDKHRLNDIQSQRVIYLARMSIVVKTEKLIRETL